MTVIKADTAVYGGYVISRAEGVVFIRGALPGEVVEVSLKEKKRDYSVAEVTDIIEPSADRVEPLCPYFWDCGGCQLQFASYDKQVAMKTGVLMDCLNRIGKTDIELQPSLTGNDFKYRHRAQFKVSKEGQIGFYREGTREVVPIKNCPLMVDQINEVLEKLQGTDLVGIKEVHVTSGDCLVALLKGVEYDDSLSERFIEMGFEGVAFDNGTYRGKGHVSFDVMGLMYTVSPWSFFQSNWTLNAEVMKIIKESLDAVEKKRVLDLYAGAGNFSLPLAREGAEVIAIEENPHAIKDGQRNVSYNKVRKYKFVKGRAEGAKFKGEFDIVLLDPPRPGLTKEAMKRVMELAPERIAYVSCNPSTFARDLGKLSKLYNIDSVRMIDLFPNTYHIESLAFLTKGEGASEESEKGTRVRFPSLLC
jgi:23S rRNA (uracil1939-C5)-methyltransferase